MTETSTMTRVSVALTGTSPLLCGKPAEWRQGLPPRQQALLRLYQNEAGQPILPAINVFRCITAAGVLLTPPQPKIGIALRILDQSIRIRSPAPWQLDTRMVRKPGSRERTPCYRPRFDQWSLQFDLDVDQELLSLANTACLIQQAGQRFGIGEFRPERGGPFGRFRLSEWGKA